MQRLIAKLALLETPTGAFGGLQFCIKGTLRRMLGLVPAGRGRDTLRGAIRVPFGGMLAVGQAE